MLRGNDQFPVRRVLLALALLLGVVTTALVVRMQESQSKNAAGTAADTQQPGVPFPRGEGNELDDLAKRQAAMALRWGNADQKIDSKWLLEAQKQVAKMPSGIPAGKVVYDRSKSNAPFALDPNAMVSLGPQPAQSDGCIGCFNSGLVSGRINHVAIDPVLTTTVYLGVSNGGVWKSTNCCTSGTAWAPTTDDPTISTLTIDEVTIDPNDHNVIYAATGDFRPSGASRGSNGVLRSRNGGDDWKVLGQVEMPPFRNNPQSNFGSSQYQAVTTVKVDPNNSNALIAGTKTEFWMSYNQGDTWTGPCYTNPYTQTNTNQRQDNTEIILRDEGTSTTIYYAIGAPFNNAVVGGNGANGIYTATMPAAGCPSTWTRITRNDNGWPGMAAAGVATDTKQGRIDLAMAPSNNDIFYAAQGALNSTVAGIYRTTNGGVTWTQVVTTNNAFVDCAGGVGVGTAIRGQTSYDQTIEVDPNDPNVVWYGEVDGFKSTNGGVNWTDAFCVYSGGDDIHSDQHDFRYFPGQSSEMLYANDGGIWYTNRANNVLTPTGETNRLPISSLNYTLNTLEFYNGNITGNFANGAQPGANGGTQDNGSFANIWEGGPGSLGPEEWQLRMGGDGFYAAIEPVNNQIYYQSNNSSNMYRSTTGPYGIYNNVSATGPWANDGRNFSMPFEIYKYDCPNTGCTHLIVGTYRVWETINGAQNASSWFIQSPRLTKTTPPNGWGSAPSITQLSYAVSLSTTAIVGTTDGNVQYGFGLGIPGSATWVNVTGGNVVLPNRPILDVTTDPLNPLMGYAAVGGFTAATPLTPGHVLQVTCTANCGSFTWVDKTGNLPDLPVDSIVVNPKFRQQVFVGNDEGLFFTNDIDAAVPVWTRFINGIPNVWVADLNVDRGFTTLAVWTRNRGLYVWPLPVAPFVQPTPTNTPVVTGTPPTATPSPTVEPVTCNTTVMTSTGNSLLPATNNTGVFADDAVAILQLPFAVPIYDRYFSQVYATTNGHLLFGPPYSTGSFSCIPARGESYAIHVNSGDLCTNDCSTPADPCASCGIFTNTIGTAPNRQFVVRWLTGYFDYTGTTEFEAVFTEGSPNVEVIIGHDQYNGLHTNSGIQRTQYDNYTTYHCNQAILTDTLKITYAISGCDAPTYTPTASATSTTTNTPTVTETSTETNTPTVTNTPTITETPTSTETNTPTNTPTSTVCPIQFQDVPPSNDESSFYPYVKCLACRNIVGGYPCGDVNPVSGEPEPCGTTGDAYYRPDNNVTRGQIAKIVAQSAGYSDDPGPQIYADVPPDQVFWLYIQQLSNDGVMGGYPCGGVNPQTGEDEECDDMNRPWFRVNNFATRGQLAKIVANAAGLNGSPSSQTYNDVPPTNDENSFYPYIEELTSMGVMGGYPCGTANPNSGPCDDQDRPYFRPSNNVTRGQAAKIVANTFFPNCQTPARPKH